VPYLKAIFAFMGITRLQFVVAEGLNVSPEMCEAGMAAAGKEIDTLCGDSACVR